MKNKLVRDCLNEFHKTGDPLSSLGVGVKGMLSIEDKKHKWGWGPEKYKTFNYAYYKPEIFDIVNYYGNYIKIFKFTIVKTICFAAIAEDLTYDNIHPNLYYTAEESLAEQIVVLKEYYEKDLKLSNEISSIANLVDLPKE